ncbi:MAG: hypothetical protein WDZ28_03420 [Simkaniaceae bacterium]
MITSMDSLVEDLSLTLDQLIQNADVLNHIESNDGIEAEVDGLKKTQESLLSHMLHVHDMIEEEKKMSKKDAEKIKQVQKKLMHFSDLNAQDSDFEKIMKRRKNRKNFGPKKWRRQRRVTN